jgi:hypothetical protein
MIGSVWAKPKIRNWFGPEVLFENPWGRLGDAPTIKRTYRPFVVIGAISQGFGGVYQDRFPFAD